MADRIDTAASRYYFRCRIADPAVIDLYAALDEVDRLRAEMDVALRDLGGWVERFDDLAAENERLTAENRRLMGDARL